MNWLIILLGLAVTAIKFGQALENNKIRSTALNPWLIAKIVLAVILLVPLLFVGLALILKPNLAITCALIIMACSPVANLSNRSISSLGGDIALTSRIELIASLISIITTPVLLEIMEYISGINWQLKPGIIIQQLFITQFIPSIIGMLLGKWQPKYIQYAEYIIKGASALLIIIFLLLIMQNSQAFAQLRIQGYMTVIVATMLAFLLGVMIGGKNTRQQISFAIETGLRNPGLAYLIATENFVEKNANIVMIPYTVTVLATSILCVYLLKLSHKFIR